MSGIIDTIGSRSGIISSNMYVDYVTGTITGGVISTYSSYTVHTFYSSGHFINNGSAKTCNVLIVAGGGGGGCGDGGGGS